MSKHRKDDEDYSRCDCTRGVISPSRKGTRWVVINMGTTYWDSDRVVGCGWCWWWLALLVLVAGFGALATLFSCGMVVFFLLICMCLLLHSLIGAFCVCVWFRALCFLLIAHCSLHSDWRLWEFLVNRGSQSKFPIMPWLSGCLECSFLIAHPHCDLEKPFHLLVADA